MCVESFQPLAKQLPRLASRHHARRAVVGADRTIAEDNGLALHHHRRQATVRLAFLHSAQKRARPPAVLAVRRIENRATLAHVELHAVPLAVRFIVEERAVTVIIGVGLESPAIEIEGDVLTVLELAREQVSANRAVFAEIDNVRIGRRLPKTERAHG